MPSLFSAIGRVQDPGPSSGDDRESFLCRPLKLFSTPQLSESGRYESMAALSSVESHEFAAFCRKTDRRTCQRSSGLAMQGGLPGPAVRSKGKRRVHRTARRTCRRREVRASTWRPRTRAHLTPRPASNPRRQVE